MFIHTYMYTHREIKRATLKLHIHIHPCVYVHAFVYTQSWK